MYTTTISAVGAIALGLAFLNAPADWQGLALFALTAAIVELTSTTLFENSRSRVSVSSIVALASIFAFGPWAGAITHMASGSDDGFDNPHSEWVRLKKRAAWWQRTTFNIGMLAIAAIKCRLGICTGRGHPRHLSCAGKIYLPILVAATMDWLVNGLLLVGVIALQTGQRPREIWNRDIKWQAPISIAGGVLWWGGLGVGVSNVRCLRFGNRPIADPFNELLFSTLQEQHEAVR